MATFPALAAAQMRPTTPGTGFGTGVYREDPATALGRYLRVITANPRDLDALIGAGRAALEVGDAQAAIGFYARAEQISPRNGRVKAGLGSALVQLNQEQAALRYFEDATQLGVAEAEIAGDRGLAHDLRGSSKRAQRDYAIALKGGADDETTRRMALSMAISGERDAALALLDPLLRRQDTAAWRARAFILAMTGDAAGANRTAESVMPANLAAGFAPFFRKLSTLRAGEKAAAVHFGLFPGESRPMRIDDLFNQAEVAARVALENSPRTATDAGIVDRSQGALGRIAARGADGEGQLTASPTPRLPEKQIAALATPRTNATGLPVVDRGAPIVARRGGASPSAMVDSALTPTQRVAPTASLVGANSVGGGAAKPGLTPSARGANPASVVPSLAGPPVSRPSLTPGFGVAASGSPAIAPPNIATASRLADISATVREVTRDPVVRATELPASSAPTSASAPLSTLQGPPARPLGETAAAAAVTSPVPVPMATMPVATGSAPVSAIVKPPVSVPKVETALAAAPPLASKPKVETPIVKVAISRPKVETPTVASPTAVPAKTKEASRIWVQIAGGADDKAFPAEWRRLKAKAPEMLSTQAAWSTPLKATNRLLVGPFESQRAAQDFVNKLAPKGITAFAWTSPDGQAIAKLAAK